MASDVELRRASLRNLSLETDSHRFMDPSRLIFLAIETTCDETGAAVLEGPRPPAVGVPRVLSSVVASQVGLHQRFGGVVPEIASRAHVRQVLPMIDEALQRAGVTLADLGAVAVATRPGLVGALVVGLTAAKALALALDIPLIAVDHLEGHLYACQLAYPDRQVYPCVGLVVSGGHTSLYRCRGPLECELLGGTTDDAAGEAFDKVASLLGLGYPGGPEIERAARAGNPTAFAFPRSFLHDARLAFSFSGLKTAVLYALRGPNERLGQCRALARHGRRPRRQLPGGRRRRPRRQDPPGPGSDRPEAPGRRRRGRRQHPLPRPDRGDGRGSWASSSSSRPCPSAPTTPPWPASPWPSSPPARSPTSTSTSPPASSAPAVGADVVGRRLEFLEDPVTGTARTGLSCR